MRLIDADKVNDHIIGWVDLRDCPTIEAIPIEWLRKYVEEWYDEEDIYEVNLYHDVFEPMFEEWREECEKLQSTTSV